MLEANRAKIVALPFRPGDYYSNNASPIQECGTRDSLPVQIEIKVPVSVHSYRGYLEGAGAQPGERRNSTENLLRFPQSRSGHVISVGGEAARIHVNHRVIIIDEGDLHRLCRTSWDRG